MKYVIHTEIDIEALPEAVWSELIDLTAYGDWNPFITSASGTPVVGDRLRLRMEPPGGRPMTFRPTVTDVAAGRVFEWRGRLGVPGVFDGRHRFELLPIETGTRLLHSEQFSGIMVRPLRRTLEGPTRAGFEAMNAALATRVTTRIPS